MITKINGSWPMAFAIIGATVCVTAICIAILVYGVDERSTPMLLPIVTTIGLLITTLANVWKTTDAAQKSAVAAQKADIASDKAEVAAVNAGSAQRTTEQVQQTTELTASQIAALRQEILADRDICLHHECPRRKQSIGDKDAADVT